MAQKISVINSINIEDGEIEKSLQNIGIGIDAMSASFGLESLDYAFSKPQNMGKVQDVYVATIRRKTPMVKLADSNFKAQFFLNFSH